jgi:hypothetical protein
LNGAGRWVVEMVESGVAVFSEVMFRRAIMMKIKRHEFGTVERFSEFYGTEM